MKIKRFFLSLLFVSIFSCLINAESQAAVSSFLGELDSTFSDLIPADGGEHAPGTLYAVTADALSAGDLSWTHTFAADLEMGPDGTIGKAEDPYIGRSWIPTQGSLTYDLGALDFSSYSVVNSLGFEFHSHGNLLPLGSGSIEMMDGAVLLASIALSPSDQFGPWSFVMPYSDFLASSQNIKFMMFLNFNDGQYGQWHVHGVSIQGTPAAAAAVPEPSTMLLLGGGLLGLGFVKKRK